ncbi:MAG: hypothetical protein HZB66_02095 [Candidatus Aenigmarchaeota archaeon]|nr:hypothetical protein [Candidatus Aenigmarchaeota archaeon]
MQDVTFFFNEKCLDYSSYDHPESPDRVRRAWEFLSDKGMSFRTAGASTDDDILSVHSRQLAENVRTGNFSDINTPYLPGIYDYAKLSAGGAIDAMKYASENGFAFSLMRPPGHHAGRASLGGFCYVKNHWSRDQWHPELSKNATITVYSGSYIPHSTTSHID